MAVEVAGIASRVAGTSSVWDSKLDKQRTKAAATTGYGDRTSTIEKGVVLYVE